MSRSRGGLMIIHKHKRCVTSKPKFWDRPSTEAQIRLRRRRTSTARLKHQWALRFPQKSKRLVRNLNIVRGWFGPNLNAHLSLYPGISQYGLVRPSVESESIPLYSTNCGNIAYHIQIDLYSLLLARHQDLMSLARFMLNCLKKDDLF